MHIVDNVEAAGRAFEALGFERIDTELNDECRGWRAENGSSVVVTARSMLARAFGDKVVARIKQSVVPYVWVDSVSVAIEELYEQATPGDIPDVLGQALTEHHTVEALVEFRGSLMLIAEKLG
jgi:hypothetical protein